jgi:hypothetical protein
MPRYNGAFQSTTLGRTIRLISGNRLLKYEEEVHVPQLYAKERIERIQTRQRDAQEQSLSPRRSDSDDATLRGDDSGAEEGTREKAAAGKKQAPVARGSTDDQTPLGGRGTGTGETAVNKEARPSTQSDAEEGQDPNLVTWYGPDDPENP